MTENPFSQSRAAGGGDDTMFDAAAAQGHLLILRIFDVVGPIPTKFCPSGWTERNGKRYPNQALRAAIVDMDVQGDDGLPGKVYAEAMIFAGMLIKYLKKDVGKMILVSWQKENPTQQSSPYHITEMSGNQRAVEAGQDFLNRHPEFLKIEEPAPWEPPAEQPQEQGYQDQRSGYQDQGYQQQRGYQDQRNNGYSSQPQGGQGQWGPDPWQQQQNQQRGNWQGQQDQGYNQHPPRQPQGQPQQGGGTFYDRFQQQRNHQGGYQNDEPPF